MFLLIRYQKRKSNFRSESLLQNFSFKNFKWLLLILDFFCNPPLFNSSSSSFFFLYLPSCPSSSILFFLQPSLQSSSFFQIFLSLLPMMSPAVYSISPVLLQFRFTLFHPLLLPIFRLRYLVHSFPLLTHLTVLRPMRYVRAALSRLVHQPRSKSSSPMLKDLDIST